MVWALTQHVCRRRLQAFGAGLPGCATNPKLFVVHLFCHIEDTSRIEKVPPSRSSMPPASRGRG